ncbi:MAG: hypothetical protein AAF632_26070 [Bacteroidota bacterium]
MLRAFLFRQLIQLGAIFLLAGHSAFAQMVDTSQFRQVITESFRPAVDNKPKDSIISMNIFANDSSFIRAILGGAFDYGTVHSADFSWTLFLKPVDFRHTIVTSYTLITHSQFNAQAYFQDMFFDSGVRFFKVKFSSDAFFRHTFFESYTEFLFTEFAGEVDFDVFKPPINWTGILVDNKFICCLFFL